MECVITTGTQSRVRNTEFHYANLFRSYLNSAHNVVHVELEESGLAKAQK